MADQEPASHPVPAGAQHAGCTRVGVLLATVRRRLAARSGPCIHRRLATTSRSTENRPSVLLLQSVAVREAVGPASHRSRATCDGDHPDALFASRRRAPPTCSRVMSSEGGQSVDGEPLPTTRRRRESARSSVALLERVEAELHVCLRGVDDWVILGRRLSPTSPSCFAGRPEPVALEWVPRDHRHTPRHRWERRHATETGSSVVRSPTGFPDSERPHPMRRL
jgi:hypothetical protein